MNLQGCNFREKCSFSPKPAFGCAAKLFLALGATIHYLNAQTKISDFLAAAYLHDPSLFIRRIGNTMLQPTALARLVCCSLGLFWQSIVEL
jgi:hypothetical protein